MPDKNFPKWIFPAGIIAIIAGLAFIPSIEEPVVSVIEKNIIWPIKYGNISQWWPSIQSIAAKYGISPAFLAAEMKQESNVNPNAVSSTGAIGLLQIEPSTGMSECGLSATQLYDPTTNLNCGAKYLADIYSKYGSYEYAAAGYYGGPGTSPVSQKGTPTVQQYVSSVMNHFNNIQSFLV